MTTRASAPAECFSPIEPGESTPATPYECRKPAKHRFYTQPGPPRYALAGV